jgi:PAS domain S-box-containing protein
LAGILAAIIPAAILASTLIPWLFDRTYSLQTQPAGLVGLATGLLMMLPYALLRTGRFSAAAMMTILLSEGCIWGAAYVSVGTTSGISALWFLGLIILLGGFFLSTPQTIVVAGASVSGFVLFPLAVPSVPANQLSSPCIFLLLVTALVVVASQIREKDLQRIESSERRLRTVVSNAPIILTVWDRDGVVTFTDGSALARMGLSPGVNVGRRVEDIYPDRPNVAAIVRRALAGETITSIGEARGVTLESHFSPITLEDGRIDGAMSVSIDVTERERQAREIEESRKQIQRAEQLSALGTLVAGVAHEVNNPLTFMKGNAELIQAALDSLASDPTLPPESREALRLSHENAALVRKGIDRIQSITKSLKQVAKASAEVRVPEDLNALADAVLTVATPRIPPDVKVKRDYRATRRVVANGNEIQQVLLNLLLNASDAMAPLRGGVLTIRTFEKGPSVVAEVSDTGPGIPLDKQTKIFTPFHTTKPTGTGLGLSVSLRIVEDHGGRLTFESSPGRGTTFRMELPAEGTPGSVAPGDAPPAQASSVAP